MIASSVVLAATVLSTLAGYAFGTMEFRGREPLFVFVIGLIIRMENIIVPLYYDLRHFDLVDTYWSVILPQVAGSVAFGTFWMRAFFLSSPRSLIEAARIDGASHLDVLRPSCCRGSPRPPDPGRPALHVLVQRLPAAARHAPGHESAATVPLAVYTFIGKINTDHNLLAAAGIIATLPVA